MRVTIKGSPKPVELNDKVALHLIKKGLAHEATAEPIAEVITQEPVVVEPVVTEPVETESVEISPRTGLPKRQYRRRDMQAEE